MPTTPASPKPVKLPPLRVDGPSDYVFKWADVDDNGNPALYIESGHKLYTLRATNSEWLEATYTPYKEPAPMTAPTPTPQTQPDRMTAAELRAAFAEIHEEITQVAGYVASLAQDLAGIREGLAHAAASASAPTAANGEEITFDMDCITLAMDETGQPAYKARGGRFSKFGVRIWPETLPHLGIDPKTLVPGPNPITPPVTVRAALTESGQPRKVTGKL